ncbi:MAG: TonB-dependent receptor, partial [Gammaproteobacteria bacterium]
MMQDILKAGKIQALVATSAAAMLIATASSEAQAAEDAAIPELQAAPQAQTESQPQAQTSEEKKKAEEEEEIEQIVVTGSRIRRSELESPAPLTIIDDEAVKLSGENNLADFLSELPALSGSLTPDQQTGASLGLAGLNLLNLRNLGSVR